MSVRWSFSPVSAAALTATRADAGMPDSPRMSSGTAPALRTSSTSMPSWTTTMAPGSMPSAISTFLTASEIAMMRSGRRQEPKRPIWNSTRRVATILQLLATGATSVNAWLSWTWMTSGWNAATVRRRCHQARGSRPMSHAVPSTLTPSAAARCASSLACLVTSACSIFGARLSSRQRSRTWFWPPRHPRPESTCRTRSLLHSGEYAAQCVEFEGLLEEGAAQLFEELQRVAADRVARGKNDAIGHRRVHARERVEHLAPAQPGHTQIADDQIEWLHQRALERLTPVLGQHHLMTPAFERRLHVVENVRLVIHHEYPEVYDEDRKSTRLNSSHDQISYAVFCLKKKKYAHTGEEVPSTLYAFSRSMRF